MTKYVYVVQRSLATLDNSWDWQIVKLLVEPINISVSYLGFKMGVFYNRLVLSDYETLKWVCILSKRKLFSLEKSRAQFGTKVNSEISLELKILVYSIELRYSVNTVIKWKLFYKHEYVVYLKHTYI